MPTLRGPHTRPSPCSSLPSTAAVTATVAHLRFIRLPMISTSAIAVTNALSLPSRAYRSPLRSSDQALRRSSTAAAATATSTAVWRAARAAHACPLRLFTAGTTTTPAAPPGPAMPSPPIAATTGAPSTEVPVYDTFAFCEADVHLALLQEAHEKHGVWINVPPQLAPSVPNVGPPAVPLPLYPRKQQERLAELERAAQAERKSNRDIPSRVGMAAAAASASTATALPKPTCLAYPPTHQPPPFATAGTRMLRISSDAVMNARTTPPGGAATAAAAASAAVGGGGEGSSSVRSTRNNKQIKETAGKTAANVADASTAPQLTVDVVPVRAAIVSTMLYHCSKCGRGFRRLRGAEEHIVMRHAEKKKSRSARTAENRGRSARDDTPAADAGLAVEEDVAEGEPARVLDGPGPGEIIGYKEVVCSSVLEPTPASVTAASTAATAQGSTEEQTEAAEGEGDTKVAAEEEEEEEERGGTKPEKGEQDGAVAMKLLKRSPMMAAASKSASPAATTTEQTTLREQPPVTTTTTTTITTTATIATTAPAATAPSPAVEASPVSASPPPGFDADMAYRSAPRVSLPEEALIDDLLASVWDEVGLARDDVEKVANATTDATKPAALPKKAVATVTTTTSSPGAKATYTSSDLPAVDSCNGRFFIPSTHFVEGQADTRTQVAAEDVNKPTARATPEGAAPGIKRVGSDITPAAMATRALQIRTRNADGTFTLSERYGKFSGGAAAATAAAIGTAEDAGRLSTAPTAQGMSIMELSRHYPNPFGDSPNAALLEQEKEPVNPFRNVEQLAESMTHAQKEQKKSAVIVTYGGSGLKKGSEAEPKEESTLASTEAGIAKGDGETREEETRQGTLETLRAQWLARPYACPLCQERALPGLTAALAALTGAASSAVAVTAAGAVRESSDGVRRKDNVRLSESKTTQAPPRRLSMKTTSSSTAPQEASCVATTFDSLDEEALTWYAQAPIPRFRLLDALEDHLEACPACCSSSAPVSVHDGDATWEPTDQDWERLYKIEVSPTTAVDAEVQAVRRTYRAAHAAKRQGKREGDAGAHDSDASRTSDTEATGGRDAADGAERGSDKKASYPLQGLDDGRDHDAAELGTLNKEHPSGGSGDAPHVHVRTAANAVLMGIVRDVQEGFVGSTRVLQYVLAVRNPQTITNATAAVAGDKKESATAAVKHSDDVDQELIVVRCIGTTVPVAMLHQQVHVGSTLLVTGSLRMNRNMDTTSRRSHAYPYVQVVPPLGCVRVVK